MSLTKKKPQRHLARRSDAAAPPVRTLTLERRVVDLLELFHVLSATAEQAAAHAAADGRAPSPELAEMLTKVARTTAGGSLTVVALEEWLQQVSPTAALEATEASHG